MKLKICLLIAVTAMVPVSLQAQNASAQGNAQAQARIEAALQAAAAADIPVALLESKVAEGKAKNIPVERIAAAVEMRLHGLTRALETLKRAEVNGASETELAVTADGLEAGVSQNALVQISRNAPAERRAVAIATLTGLVQLGHASEHALARVSAVVRSNAGLANLNAEVASQLGVGAGGRAGLNGAGVVRIK